MLDRSLSVGLLILTIFVFSSCTKNPIIDDYNSSPNSNNAITYGRITIKDIKKFPSNPSSIWKDINDSITIEFETCLSSPALNDQKIAAEKVTVKSPIGPAQTPESIHTGCINWIEKINYNYFTSERYYVFPITLKAKSFISSEQTINLAINPWAATKDQILIDTRFPYNQNLTQEKITSNLPDTTQSIDFSNIKNNIVLNNIEFGHLKSKYLKQQKTNIIDFFLKANVQIQRKGLNDEDIFTPLHEGKFNIEFMLIEKLVNQNNRIQIHSTSTQEITIQQNEIKKVISFPLDEMNFYHMADNIIQVYFKITPLNAPAGWGITQGHITLDQNLSNMDKNISYINQEITYAKKLNKKEHVTTTNNNKQYDKSIKRQIHYQNKNDNEFGVVFSEITFKRGPLLQISNKNIYQKQLYNEINICLIESFKGVGSKKITEGEFQLEFILADGTHDSADNKKRNSTINPKTGCLKSYFYLPFDIYEQESYRPMNLKLTALSGNHKGVIKNRILACNPWNKSTLCYDTKVLAAPDIAPRGAAQIYFKNVVITPIGNNPYSYKIDKFLNLSLERTYALDMRAQVLFQTQTNLPVDIPTDLIQEEYTLVSKLYTIDAEYYEKLQLGSIDWSRLQLLTQGQQKTNVTKGGNITTNISLPFMATDLPMLVLKNIMTLTLIPNSNKTKLRPITMASYVELSKAEEPLNFIQVTPDSKQRKFLSAQDKLIKNDSKKTSLKLYRKAIIKRLKVFNKSHIFDTIKIPKYIMDQLDDARYNVNFKIYSTHQKTTSLDYERIEWNNFSLTDQRNELHIIKDNKLTSRSINGQTIYQLYDGVPNHIIVVEIEKMLYKDQSKKYYLISHVNVNDANATLKLQVLNQGHHKISDAKYINFTANLKNKKPRDDSGQLEIGKVNAEPKLIFASLNQYNQMVQMKDQLSGTDLRQINSDRRTTLEHLRKFCQSILLVKDDVDACLNNPRKYIDFFQVSHVVKIKNDYKAIIVDPLDNDHDGVITKGYGFFAAYGQRSYRGKGKTISQLNKVGIDVNFSPPPYLMGPSAGRSKLTEDFTKDSVGDIQYSLQRTYSGIEKERMQYERLKLQFSSKVLQCVFVRGIKAKVKSNLIHLCRDTVIPNDITEEWFFIGFKVSQRSANLLTSNGQTRKLEGTQIIRGRHKFNTVWNQYQNDDTYFIMSDMGKVDYKGAFKQYKIKGDENRLGQGYKNNNFPGVVEPSNKAREEGNDDES